MRGWYLHVFASPSPREEEEEKERVSREGVD
jgi:hypothetical protein